MVSRIETIRPRLQIAGRIRAGKKVDGVNRRGEPIQRPGSIGTFRFTSHDRDLVEAVAAEYGGQARPWDEPRAPGEQWEVETEARKIDILLPPDPIDGPVYELWSGGGRARRCDTIECEAERSGPDGPELVVVPCMCEAAARAAGQATGPSPSGPFDIPRDCRLKTRLVVLLPQFQLAGAWRIDSGSRAAAETWPGMVSVISSMEARGLPAGYLFIQERESGGGRRQWREIQLGLRLSPNELAAAAGSSTGQASLDTPAEQPPLAISSGPTVVVDDAASMVAAGRDVGLSQADLIRAAREVDPDVATMGDVEASAEAAQAVWDVIDAAAGT